MTPIVEVAAAVMLRSGGQEFLLAQRPDGKVYAVAQGPILVGGYTVSGVAASTTKNVPTAGRIPNGAIVERDVPTDYAGGGQLALLLRNPDFTTAQRISDAINSTFGAVAVVVDVDAAAGVASSWRRTFITRSRTAVATFAAWRASPAALAAS